MRQFTKVIARVISAKSFRLSVLFVFLVATSFFTNVLTAIAADPVTASSAVKSAFLTPGIQALEWNTQQPHARGTIITVHGTTQQAGCFSSLAKVLNSAGFNVVSMDLRGHGRWYFSTDLHNNRHEVSYSRSAADLAAIGKHLKAINPRLPLFCIGESIGAAVTVRATSEHPELFDGIVLASAGTTPHIFNVPMVARDVVKGLSNIDRPLDVSQYITRYSSEDPRITKEMTTDPLSRTMLTGKEIIQTGAFIRRTASTARRLPRNISVLVLNGANDQIVSVDSTEEILDNISSNDKKMVVVPNCGHILLGTAYLKQAVVTPLTNWLIYQTDCKQTATSLHRRIQ